jgi:hypothetical protein
MTFAHFSGFGGDQCGEAVRSDIVDLEAAAPLPMKSRR